MSAPGGTGHPPSRAVCEKSSFSPFVGDAGKPWEPSLVLHSNCKVKALGRPEFCPLPTRLILESRLVQNAVYPLSSPRQSSQEATLGRDSESRIHTLTGAHGTRGLLRIVLLVSTLRACFGCRSIGRSNALVRLEFQYRCHPRVQPVPIFLELHLNSETLSQACWHQGTFSKRAAAKSRRGPAATGLRFWGVQTNGGVQPRGTVY